MEWYIGCSGFYYKEWKEVFYPKGLAQKDWFKYYCKNFNTIEVNSTFYKMPAQKSFEKWYNESPDHFLFTIKAPRLITHYKQLDDCKVLLTDFYLALNEGLREKLGCVLFQFPPKFSFSEERLALILKNLNPDFRNVIEFRHKSWWQVAIFDALKKENIIFSGASFPGDLPDEVIQNTDAVYYRFHGKPVLYKSEYDIKVLLDFVNQIPKSTKQVFVYFNNTWGTGALNNSKQLQAMV
ncbi:DUF72 domain-containing protein [Pedobacter punctiformis]|uniref:DUF72 domain-containing protein n=1 Tax=Pedobacter punctiformis TaxID=3004097 RepID=A0ABT4L927_9SPHI|nr:DUF72 domain-containing protein [Pedobacter sp. HCMS5-2]MCZ4244426.1 DUF72 domain-containing protein [Pedobacter sp. HCMS5-2]